ncbi:MAG: hypothetical protein ACRDQA_00275 [Nocardioidaceae bacterium]
MIHAVHGCETPGCDRPAEHATICSGCARELERALAEVPALAVELDTTLARLGARTTGTRRSAVTPLPYDQRASEASWVLRNTLSTWCRLVCEERDLTPPRDNLASMGRWLTGSAGWLARHPAGGEACDEITTAVSAAWRVTDRAPDRVYVGPCGHVDPEQRIASAVYGIEPVPCPADLYATPGAATVACRTCGHERDVAATQDALMAAADDHLATAVEISHLISRYYQPVTPAAIRGLAHRGAILAHSEDKRGRPRYRVGDVLDTLARRVACA